MTLFALFESSPRYRGAEINANKTRPVIRHKHTLLFGAATATEQ